MSYPTYFQVVAKLKELAAQAPHLIQIWNAQEEYQLDSPGECFLNSTASEPCKHWFVTVTDSSAVFPPVTERPEVFFSGNLHGDEVVGPITLYYFLQHIVLNGLRGENVWINNLLRTRVIVALPISNPLGYVLVSRNRLLVWVEVGPRGRRAVLPGNVPWLLA